jgi:hypothetical protein
LAALAHAVAAEVRHRTRDLANAVPTQAAAGAEPAAPAAGGNGRRHGRTK